MPCDWNNSNTPLGRNHRHCRPGGAYDLHSPRYEHIGLNFPKDSTTVKFDFSGLNSPSSSSSTTINFNVNAGSSRPSGWSLFGGFLGNTLGNLLGMGLMGAMMKGFMPENVSSPAPAQAPKVYADSFIPSAGPQKLPSVTGTTAVQEGGKTEEIEATVGGHHGYQAITGKVISQVAGDESTGGWPREFVISDKTNNKSTDGNQYTFALVAKPAEGEDPDYRCIHIKASVKNGCSLSTHDVTYQMGSGVNVKDGKIVTPKIQMSLDSASEQSPVVGLSDLAKPGDTDTTVLEKDLWTGWTPPFKSES